MTRLEVLQRVHGGSGVAMAQPIANSHTRGSPAGSGVDTVQHYATMAAKTSGKHIKNIGEAGYKYLSSQVRVT